MAVLKQHRKFYEDLFKIDGFIKSPFLMFGFQEISKDFEPKHRYNSFREYLFQAFGLDDISVLDYSDSRADIYHDMNYPFTQNTNKLIGAFNVVCDIGCLEHVFDTAQCLKNCLSMVAPGGLYCLHTPVNGYFKHGLHTFNPDMLKWVLVNNGFDIVYEKYSSKQGSELSDTDWGPFNDTLIWLVGRRVSVKDRFYIPIQDKQIPLHKSK